MRVIRNSGIGRNVVQTVTWASIDRTVEWMIIRELLKCLGWEITSPVLKVLDNCATASQVANVLDNFSIELVYH